MSYHKAPALGWELSLVSGFKLEPSGKIHGYRLPLLAPLQSFSILSGLCLFVRCMIWYGGQSFLLGRAKSDNRGNVKQKLKSTEKPLNLGNFCMALFCNLPRACASKPYYGAVGFLESGNGLLWVA